MLQQKCKIKGGTGVWRLRNMCLAWKNSELFLFLFFQYSVQKKIAWRKSGMRGGGYSPLSPLGVVGPAVASSKKVNYVKPQY